MSRRTNRPAGRTSRIVPAATRSLLRYACESLEQRMLLTATLYIDYGDRFPSGALNTTVDALDSTVSGSNPDVDGPRLSDDDGNNYADGTALTINSVNALYSATAAADLRSTMTALAQRFFEPFDITVVELTDTLQNVNGHMVRAAASLAEISETLGINEGDAENNDSYIIVGQFLIGASNDNPAVFPNRAYGGLSTGADIGGNNANDGTALVCLIGSGDSARFNGPQIAHEAGHAFGLEHAYRQDTSNAPPASITNTTATGAQYDQLHQSELMSYLGYRTQGGFNVFSRYPTMDGDGNGDANVLANAPTPYDQMANDPNIGPSNISYVTGTGTHDLITLTRTGANSANVTVQPFADAAYSTTIDAPGATGNSFSYSISLDRPLTIDAGGRNDRVTLDGDLGISINLRGMHGDDELIVMGKNAASAIYTTGTNAADGLDLNPDLRGSIEIGGTTINFQEFEPLSNVTIRDVTTLTLRTGGSRDDLTLDSPSAGQMRVDGTSDLVDMVPLTFFNVSNFTLDTGLNDGAAPNDDVLVAASSIAAGLNTLSITTGAGDDELDVNFASGNPIPAGGLSFNAGIEAGPSDLLNLRGGSFTNEVYTATGSDSGTITLDGSVISYFNLAPIVDTVPVANFTFNATAGADTINVIDSLFFNGFDTTQINSGNGTFERVDFANKTAVTINALGGADTFNISGVDPADGLTQLLLNGNGEADIFNLSGVFPSLPTSAFGGANGDTFNFDGAGAGAGSSVLLDGQGGDDRFNVTASANAPLTITGGAGSDFMAIDGEAASFDVTDTTFTSAGLQTITYGTLERLELSDGTFGIALGVTVTTPIHVNLAATLIGDGAASGGITANNGGTVSPGVAAPGVLGSGNLAFNAGSNYTLDLNGTAAGDHDELNVTGTVTLDNTATLAATVGFVSIPGDEIVIIRNDGNDAVVGQFAGGLLLELGGAKFTIDYGYDADGDGAFNDVALIRYGAQLADDPCNPGEQALFVSATSGADDVRVIPGPGNARGEAIINGTSEGLFDFKGHIYIMGQNGDDTVAVTMPARTAFLYGNTGDDLVLAGNSDSILIGGFGDDTCRAGNGKDILIGGAGADLLEAGSGADILIAGATTHDPVNAANRVALCELADLWKHGQKPSSLSGLLNAATLIADTDADQLFGQTGTDYFLLQGADDTHDASKQETVQEV